MRLLHAGLAVILILAHGTFLFRGLMLRRHGGRPGRLDRTARTLSHIGLPAVVVSGLAAWGIAGKVGALHAVLGLLPLATIIAFAPLLTFKRRIPWLLPALNLLFFVAAALSALIERAAL